ncbi:unnamed protein product [Didymodactylos carnosus]|uniref:Uncharacterized protein n=1 Tax=Didymodactylos carnosus TaxID=1234261 RepID=A0A813QSI9_9BILA|nr:unnamed protein product [Didymodactylos carnosus]CAF1152549.1 unnamed protein product [Didymodactylos carnosus]CAF3554470.1 unnamed protein product [Didymodactylos carnosus]CAF3961121.1 unnamed protein product [Didymodactylos carnosus]
MIQDSTSIETMNNPVCLSSSSLNALQNLKPWSPSLSSNTTSSSPMASEDEDTNKKAFSSNLLSVKTVGY